MLLLKARRHRLSIDIDIICPPGTEIGKYLQSYKDYGFIDYKPILAPTLPSRLNKLKRTSPEAYFYWAKTSQLL